MQTPKKHKSGKHHSRHRSHKHGRSKSPNQGPLPQAQSYYPSNMPTIVNQAKKNHQQMIQDQFN